MYAPPIAQRMLSLKKIKERLDNFAAAKDLKKRGISPDFVVHVDPVDLKSQKQIG